ncbi:hypothetical protein [Variovorax sp. HJSM1_2]|uniref:hypothetical protein n=1 Tax=Variovorax sp. HJSM1_2 TaxID=3366263 RepID=UPI003BBB9C25
MMLGLAKGAAGLAAGAALPSMTKAIYSLYGMTGSINTFVDGHIDQLKNSKNQTASQTGAILEGAKFGFGLGYLSSVIVIAVGQHLLGNTLSAVGTLVSATTMSNPIAMTCAAVGAIYYGWRALEPAQQNAIVDSVTRGLELGAQLIKSVIDFLITQTKELVSSQTASEFKKQVMDYADAVTKALNEAAGKVGNLMVEASGKANDLRQVAGSAATAAVESTTVALKSAANSASDALRVAYEKTGRAATNLAGSAKKTLGWNKPEEPAASKDQPSV